ncbi:MAG: NAD(P)-binding domain-containing protein [Clostridiales bacterium]|nr:NAD(P)-binding domain-containing protein [Clostridiales bacterium]
MKIAIIGFGNLGHSLAEGLIKSGTASGKDICVCDKAPEIRELASVKYGLSATDDINCAISGTEVVFLVVKSYVFEELAPAVNRELLEGKTVVSFMAGAPFEMIYSLIGQVDLVRGMPSLAIAACDGVVAYTKAPPHVADIFHKLGYAFEVAPGDVEKVMAFSSCGLGFAAYLIDAFAAAGEKMGFSPETCTQIAARTFQNAIDRGDYKNTVKAVATKGGATEQGVLHMDASNVYGIMAEAVQKAYDRMK